jgi:hypothetical protein
MKPSKIILSMLAGLFFVAASAFGDDIFDAAKSGDLEKVKALLKDNPDLVFRKDILGQTPLHLAAWNGHKDAVELLLVSKADVNAKDKGGATPLFMAAWKGQKDVVELRMDAALRSHGRAQRTSLRQATGRRRRNRSQFTKPKPPCQNQQQKLGLLNTLFPFENGFGRAVSRILSAFLRTERIICLSDRYPKPVSLSRNLERAAPGFPIWPCTRWGFPCRVACASRGGLLHHLFTLATGLRRWRSVFCGTLRRKVFQLSARVYLRSKPELRGIAPDGVRTFLFRLAPKAILRPSKTDVKLTEVKKNSSCEI